MILEINLKGITKENNERSLNSDAGCRSKIIRDRGLKWGRRLSQGRKGVALCS